MDIEAQVCWSILRAWHPPWKLNYIISFQKQQPFRNQTPLLNPTVHSVHAIYQFKYYSKIIFTWGDRCKYWVSRIISKYLTLHWIRQNSMKIKQTKNQSLFSLLATNVWNKFIKSSQWRSHENFGLSKIFYFIHC